MADTAAAASAGVTDPASAAASAPGPVPAEEELPAATFDTAETGLPRLWEVRHSRSKGLPYYFNADTKESRWEPPAGTDPDQLKVFMAAHHTAALPSAAPAAAPPAADGFPVSNGFDGGRIRAAHLLVKHAGSRRPSSWKEREVTRSEDEALQTILAYEARIRAGETTLAELAVSESDCSSARKHGDLGFFGHGDMQKEFEDAAFALQPGEISGVVKTASGLHLIQRLD